MIYKTFFPVSNIDEMKQFFTKMHIFFVSENCLTESVNSVKFQNAWLSCDSCYYVIVIMSLKGIRFHSNCRITRFSFRCISLKTVVNRDAVTDSHICCFCRLVPAVWSCFEACLCSLLIQKRNKDVEQTECLPYCGKTRFLVWNAEHSSTDKQKQPHVFWYQQQKIQRMDVRCPIQVSDEV